MAKQFDKNDVADEIQTLVKRLNGKAPVGLAARLTRLPYPDLAAILTSLDESIAAKAKRKPRESPDDGCACGHTRREHFMADSCVASGHGVCLACDCSAFSLFSWSK